MENYKEWNKKKRPILLICKTNHALDMFLKHIEKFEQGIVRIGGRSKEESMKKYNLKAIRDQYKKEGGKFYMPSIGDIKEMIYQFEEYYRLIQFPFESEDLIERIVDEYKLFNFDLEKK